MFVFVLFWRQSVEINLCSLNEAGRVVVVATQEALSSRRCSFPVCLHFLFGASVCDAAASCGQIAGSLLSTTPRLMGAVVLVPFSAAVNSC